MQLPVCQGPLTGWTKAYWRHTAPQVSSLSLVLQRAVTSETGLHLSLMPTSLQFVMCFGPEPRGAIPAGLWGSICPQG